MGFRVYGSNNNEPQIPPKTLNEALSDFNVSAGLLTLRGPNKQEMKTATLGEEFQVAISAKRIRV